MLSNIRSLASSLQAGAARLDGIGGWGVAGAVAAVGIAGLWYASSLRKNPFRDLDMTGKRVLVTGGNSGLGLETAVWLYGRGADVTIACRSKPRGEAAVEEIMRKGAEIPEAKPGVVALELLDLGDLESVRACVERITAKDLPIDILVDNAGILMVEQPRRETKQGLEATFGINHVGHFLFTLLLRPLLARGDAGRGGRVVVVSSMLAGQGRFNWEDLQRAGPGAWNGLSSYADSKLANALFAKSVCDLAGDGILAASCHPGGVATNIYRDLPQWMQTAGAWLEGTAIRSPAVGAWTQLMLAMAPREYFEEHAGRYFDDCAPATIHRDLNDPAQRARLWRESIALAGLTEAEVEELGWVGVPAVGDH